MKKKKTTTKINAFPSLSGTMVTATPVEHNRGSVVSATTSNGYYNFKPLIQSGWKCELFGGSGGVTWFPYKGQVPNRFWRFMQYICFGNKWTHTK